MGQGWGWRVSRENGVCLPGNQPGLLGRGVVGCVVGGEMPERRREQGNSRLKTVKFKLKGQDTIQVLPPLSSPPFSSP